MRTARVSAAALLALAILPLACRKGPRIDERYRSRNHDSRVRFVVLHYTAEGFDSALDKLTTGEVSAHYLVTDGRDGRPVTIYRLVDENERAWHAGNSAWLGTTQLNACSIGIEIVNRGFVDGPTGRVWEPYPVEQIDAVVELVADVAKRHGIPPERIVGHAEIQPRMKLDPGPLFPWNRLAAKGLARWPDEAEVERMRPLFPEPPSPIWFQERLAAFGYGENVPKSGVLDEATCDVLASFQAKYRPERCDGAPDPETAAILAAMVRE